MLNTLLLICSIALFLFFAVTFADSIRKSGLGADGWQAGSLFAMLFLGFGIAALIH